MVDFYLVPPGYGLCHHISVTLTNTQTNYYIMFFPFYFMFLGSQISSVTALSIKPMPEYMQMMKYFRWHLTFCFTITSLEVIYHHDHIFVCRSIVLVKQDSLHQFSRPFWNVSSTLFKVLYYLSSVGLSIYCKNIMKSLYFWCSIINQNCSINIVCFFYYKKEIIHIIIIHAFITRKLRCNKCYENAEFRIKRTVPIPAHFTNWKNLKSWLDHRNGIFMSETVI